MSAPAHHACTLPSQGLFYGDSLPGGKVFVRKMTIDEEEAIQSPGLDPFTRLSLIARNSCILAATPDPAQAKLKFDELLYTDQQAILLRQRLITHGPNYLMKFRCVNCQQNCQNTHNVEAEWNEITPDVCVHNAAEKGIADFHNEEPFLIHLPDMGADLQIKFLRMRDIIEINRLVKQLRAVMKDSRNPAARVTLARSIVSIDGDASKNDIQKAEWLRQVTSSDHRLIRQERELRETCIDTSLNSICSGCGTTNTLDVQMDFEFFLPP